jgi:thiol-disulfide isomerase/thioredoxin
MRHLSLFLAALVVSLFAAASYQRVFADPRLPPPDYQFSPAPGCTRQQKFQPRIYDDCADQMSLFQRARAEAFGAKKQVLVVFGANWCPSCRTFKTLTESPDFVSRPFKGKPLAERLHMVEIAVSRLHEGKVASVPSGEAVLNGVLAARPDLKQRTIPFIAVIDPITGRISARNLDDLAGPAGWHASAVATVLAAADDESRGGPKAPGEPGWLKRKWQRWFGP